MILPLKAPGCFSLESKCPLTLCRENGPKLGLAKQPDRWHLCETLPDHSIKPRGSPVQKDKEQKSQ